MEKDHVRRDIHTIENYEKPIAGSCDSIRAGVTHDKEDLLGLLFAFVRLRNYCLKRERDKLSLRSDFERSNFVARKLEDVVKFHRTSGEITGEPCAYD